MDLDEGLIDLTGDSGDDEPHPSRQLVAVSTVPVKKEAGFRFKPKAVPRRSSLPSPGGGPRPAASCTGSTGYGAPGTSSRRSGSPGPRRAPSSPPLETTIRLLLPQAELPSASCCGGAPARSPDVEEPDAARGGAGSSNESPSVSSVGDATAETLDEPNVEEGQDNVPDPPSSTDTAVPSPPTIEELDAEGVSEQLPVQYTKGITELGERWEDPRRLPWIVVDYKGGCRVKLRGSDLYKEGDIKFDVHSYDGDGEDYDIDEILVGFRVGDKNMYLVKWAGYEVNPLHCGWITELEFYPSDDEEPNGDGADADASVDLLERYKARCEELGQQEMLDMSENMLCCQVCPNGTHLLFDKAMAIEELQSLQKWKNPKKSRKKGSGASNRRNGKEPVQPEDDSGDETYYGVGEDEEISDDDSDGDEPFQKARKTLSKKRPRKGNQPRSSRKTQKTKAKKTMSKTKAKKMLMDEYDAKYTVDCPSKLLPPEEPNVHAPYFLVEQVYNRGLMGGDSDSDSDSDEVEVEDFDSYWELMRGNLDRYYRALKIIKTDSGKEGFSIALRKRIFMTNILGHLPTEDYVAKAKAGALADLLKQKLEVRPLAEVIGWEAKDGSSNPEDDMPAFFLQSLKGGFLQCIKGRDADSHADLTRIQEWQRANAAPDGSVPDHLRFKAGTLHKCGVNDESKSCKCALQKVRGHSMVPDPTHHYRGLIRALETEEALELQGFPRNLFKERGDAYLRYDGGKIARKLIGQSFQVDAVARLLAPLVAAEDLKSKLQGDGIVVVSLCDGIGGAIHALGKLTGMKVKAYIFAEKEKAARNITDTYLNAEWPKTERYPLENVQQLLESDLKEKHPKVYDLLSDVDLVIFGPPCNDLSSANRNPKGIVRGEKSSVFFQCERVLYNITERKRKAKDLEQQAKDLEQQARIEHLEKQLEARCSGRGSQH